MGDDDDKDDSEKIAKAILGIWQYAGLAPPADRELLALSTLVLALSSDESDITLTYDFEGGRLKEYVMRAKDGRLVGGTVFRSDGSSVDLKELDGDEREA